MYSIVATQPGDISVLQKKEFEISEILPNQVLIKNHSIGVNFIDIYFRQGLYPWPQENNLVLGSEGAGIIEAVGSDVVNLRVGDRVAYAMCMGSYAQYAVVPSWKAVILPKNVDSRLGAAVILQGMTAHYLSDSTYSLGARDTALVHAAAGGRGREQGWPRFHRHQHGLPH